MDPDYQLLLRRQDLPTIPVDETSTAPKDIDDIFFEDLEGKDVSSYFGRVVVGPNFSTSFGRCGNSPGVFLLRTDFGQYGVAVPSEQFFMIHHMRYADDGNYITHIGYLGHSARPFTPLHRALSIHAGVFIQHDALYEFLVRALIQQGQGHIVDREELFIDPRAVVPTK